MLVLLTSRVGMAEGVEVGSSEQKGAAVGENAGLGLSSKGETAFCLLLALNDDNCC